MKIQVTVFFACLLSLAWAEFRIGAFNVQVFGQTKAGKPDVMEVLAKIIQRYDILLIQEIRDIKGTAITQLLQQTNDLGPNKYAMEISERLGRTNSKEQYAFLYKENAGITVDGTYQYPDPDDKFEREPFSVKFTVSNTEVGEFVLAGVHVDPDDAVAEIDALVPAHQDLAAHWSTDNIVIMGDFNAECSYVSKTRLAQLLLRNDDRFTWLIGDEVDTTTKSTNCAYDRVVVSGDQLVQAVVAGSSEVYRFDEEHGLDQTQTEAVSDHYPVEFRLGTKFDGISSASTLSTVVPIATTTIVTSITSGWWAWLRDIWHTYRRLEL